MGSTSRWGQVALPFFALTIVTFIWASNTIVSKIILTEISPAQLTATRFTLTGVSFHLPALLLLVKHGWRLRRGEWVRLAAMGIVGQAGSSLTFTMGVTYTTATYAGLILMTGPLFTALMAWAFERERLSKSAVVGMSIAFLAAGFLATDGRMELPNPGVLIGVGYLLVAQVFWGGYILVGKRLLGRRPPLLVLTTTNAFALLGVWPMTLALGAWGDVHELASASIGSWLGIVYLAVFTGALSQLLFLYGLRAVSAAQASSFTYLQPVFTGSLAMMVLDEQPTLLTLVCGLLIIVGVWLVNRPASYKGPSRGPALPARSPSTGAAT